MNFGVVCFFRYYILYCKIFKHIYEKKLYIKYVIMFHIKFSNVQGYRVQTSQICFIFALKDERICSKYEMIYNFMFLYNEFINPLSIFHFKFLLRKIRMSFIRSTKHIKLMYSFIFLRNINKFPNSRFSSFM